MSAYLVMLHTGPLLFDASSLFDMFSSFCLNVIVESMIQPPLIKQKSMMDSISTFRKANSHNVPVKSKFCSTSSVNWQYLQRVHSRIHGTQFCSPLVREAGCSWVATWQQVNDL